LLVVHVNVTSSPSFTELADAVRLRVGAAAANETVAERVTLPPLPEQVSE
jgi:hypothetical protein